MLRKIEKRDSGFIRESVDSAREKLHDGWDSAKDKFEDVEDSTVQYIKKNPMKSTLIALGIGAAIGAVIALGTSSAIQSRKRSFWDRHNLF